ncbi:ATP-binding cassette domain-containing protein [Crossiella sp. SN42]|uniref:ATP-binding cassette domain-containing protein n=1 Tax=Crossiella sp. SN42 TaxID=2944808 RepID=UPI0035AB8F4A
MERLLAQSALTGIADQRVGRYSTGAKRRLGIAQALLGEPRLLVVDERRWRSRRWRTGMPR